MKLEYSRHAEKRAAQRHISKKMIMETIESPDWQYPSYGKTVSAKKYDDKVSEVVWKKKNKDVYYLVTVVFREANKDDASRN